VFLAFTHENKLTIDCLEVGDMEGSLEGMDRFQKRHPKTIGYHRKINYKVYISNKQSKNVAKVKNLLYVN